MAGNSQTLPQEPRNITRQAKAEEELERFKFISDNANDAIILIREDGTFAYLNDLALRRWGYTADEARTIRVPDVDPIYQDEKFNEIFARAQKQAVPAFETIHRRKDGTTFPVEISLKGSILQGRPHMLAIARDITDRKQAEERQKILIQQIVDVVESMGDAFFILDKDWCFVRVNRRQEKVCGMKRSQLIGKNFWKLFPGADDPDSRYWIEYHKAVSTGKPSHFIEYYEPLNIWTEVDAYPTADGGISVFYRDISKRKRAEEALQHQLEMTQTIINNASAGKFLLDHNGSITYMNPAATQISGHTLKEAKGKSFHGLCHHSKPDGSHYPESDCPLISTVKHGKSIHRREDIFYRKDGTTFPGIIIATPIPELSGLRSTIVELRDITEEKRATKALEESEARLRFMADSMPQQVWTATKDGKLDYVNKKVCDYFQKPAEVIIKEGWQDELHPDDLPGVLKVWNHALRTGEIYETEFRLKRGDDDSYRWHLARALPISNQAGEVEKWFGSNTDIQELRSTAQRRDELERIAAALREQRAQLIELNKAKDEFISLSSHQLRTPATGVKQYIGMVLEGYAGEITPQQRAFLEQAYQSNERQITIVNDLLKVAQVDAGKVHLQKEKVDLAALLRDILDEQASKFESRKQKVTFHCSHKRLQASIDKGKIRMVLENIIDNASKYTPIGKNIHISLEKSGREIIIAVSDNGVGIPKEDIDKLFHKFTRLDNPLSVTVGGSGLGLYWAKKIVDLHGGTIAVDSKVNKGSTFTIQLPRS